MIDDMFDLTAPEGGPYTLSAEEQRLMMIVRQMLELRLVERPHKVLKRVRMRRKRRPLKCMFYSGIVLRGTVSVPGANSC